MELSPPPEALPELFGPLRRRHPDVDLVLVPEAPIPIPGPAPAARDQAGERDADRLDTALDTDLDRVARSVADAWAAVTGDRPEVCARPGFGPREDTVVARARHHGGPVPSPGPALAAHLAAGWQVRAPRGAAGPVLARRDGLELVATYAAGAGVLVVTVTSAPVRVGLARARALVGP